MDWPIGGQANLLSILGLYGMFTPIGLGFLGFGLDFLDFSSIIRGNPDCLSFFCGLESLGESDLDSGDCFCFSSGEMFSRLNVEFQNLGGVLRI